MLGRPTFFCSARPAFFCWQARPAVCEAHGISRLISFLAATYSPPLRTDDSIAIGLAFETMSLARLLSRHVGLPTRRYLHQLCYGQRDSAVTDPISEPFSGVCFFGQERASLQRTRQRIICPLRQHHRLPAELQQRPDAFTDHLIRKQANREITHL